MGSNSLNTDCSCHVHSHLQAGSTVMLSNYRWDTGLMGKNTCSPSRRNRETDSASSDSVSTNQSIENTFTACVRLVMRGDCSVGGAGSEGMTSPREAAIFVPLANQHIPRQISIGPETACTDIIWKKKPHWPKNLQKADQLCFSAFFYNLQYTMIEVSCCQQVARPQEEMTPS